AEYSQPALRDRGGDGSRKATALQRDWGDYVWAPAGHRVALVAERPHAAKPKAPAPIVIDRFQFKQDESGYLSKRRRHLYGVDIETGKATLLTPGDYDDLLPAWSPDGKSLAFVSKRRPDADRDNNWDVYVMEAVPGATP